MFSFSYDAVYVGCSIGFGIELVSQHLTETMKYIVYFLFCFFLRTLREVHCTDMNELGDIWCSHGNESMRCFVLTAIPKRPSKKLVFNCQNSEKALFFPFLWLKCLIIFIKIKKNVCGFAFKSNIVVHIHVVQCTHMHTHTEFRLHLKSRDQELNTCQAKHYILNLD